MDRALTPPTAPPLSQGGTLSLWFRRRNYKTNKWDQNTTQHNRLTVCLDTQQALNCLWGENTGGGLTWGPQKPWLTGPTPSSLTYTHLELLANRSLLWEFWVYFIVGPCRARQLFSFGCYYFYYFVFLVLKSFSNQSRRGWGFACSEWTSYAVSRRELDHLNTSLVHTVLYTKHQMHHHLRHIRVFEHPTHWPHLSGLQMKSHGLTRHPHHACCPLSFEAHINGPRWLCPKCLGASGIQLAFEARIVILTRTATAPPSAREDQYTLKWSNPAPSLTHTHTRCALLGLLLLF